MKEKCKKLVYQLDEKFRPVLYGIIESTDSDFIYFKTAKKNYQISKKDIISIEDTDRDFSGGFA